MSSQREMMENLILDVMMHVNEEIRFTFTVNVEQEFDIIAALEDLDNEGFAAFGNRATSFANMMEPFKDYEFKIYKKKSEDMKFHDKVKSLLVLKEYFEEAMETVKESERSASE